MKKKAGRGVAKEEEAWYKKICRGAAKEGMCGGGGAGVSKVSFDPVSDEGTGKRTDNIPTGLAVLTDA